MLYNYCHNSKTLIWILSVFPALAGLAELYLSALAPEDAVSFYGTGLFIFCTAGLTAQAFEKRIFTTLKTF